MLEVVKMIDELELETAELTGKTTKAAGQGKARQVQGIYRYFESVQQCATPLEHFVNA